jgi:hypothetical protein
MERCYSQLELSFGLVTSTHIVTSKWSIGWVGSTVDWDLYNYWNFFGRSRKGWSIDALISS